MYFPEFPTPPILLKSIASPWIYLDLARLHTKSVLRDFLRTNYADNKIDVAGR